MRTARGLSLGQLARRAGLSKAALSQWETGKRQPRVVELETTLEALGASAAQRLLAFARIEAPRALRHLRQSASQEGMTAPPVAGDLLRAMRLRHGWTQEQVGQRLGVERHSVARWELGERLPSIEQIQSLCYALDAREEELVALTTGAFSMTPRSKTKHWAEADIAARLLVIHDGQPGGLPTGLEDLNYLTLEREVWEWAARTEAARNMLGQIYASHATFCRNQERWSEVQTLVQQALLLLSEAAPGPHYARARLVEATVAVYGGHQVAPERGMALIQALLDWPLAPEYAAWALSDMAKYMALGGKREAGLSLAGQAIRVAEQSRNIPEVVVRWADYGELLLEAGRPDEALRVLPDPWGFSFPRSVETMLLVTKAHYQAGNLSEAHDWLQQASDLIAKHDLDRLRPKAQALEQQF
jgi:transcriptional regulator with XRE-family HTH domain